MTTPTATQQAAAQAAKRLEEIQKEIAEHLDEISQIFADEKLAEFSVYDQLRWLRRMKAFIGMIHTSAFTMSDTITELRNKSETSP